MKRIPILLVLLTTVAALSLNAAEKKFTPAKHPALNSPTVVWAGLDFTMVRMIGAGAFNNPDAIFPGMLESWNNLFLRERLKSVGTETKKTVLTDIGGAMEANKAATPKQIITAMTPDDTLDKSHISAADIARAVKGYKLESKDGLGVVMIADRFVKVDKQAQGAVYVVCFDIASREVIASERRVCKAGGAGFRNYWFRVIKDAEPALRMCR